MAISVLEHIPPDLDIAVVAEMSRVLASGGVMLLTLPYAQTYQETIPPYDSEDRQRWYDLDALIERIVGPSDLQVEQLLYFGVKNSRLFPYFYLPFRFRLVASSIWMDLHADS